MKQPTSAVLVTGANSGIGRAICHRFGSNGFHVFAHVRNEMRALDLVSELEAADISVQVLVADLADPTAPERLVQQVAQSSFALTALVNNAGGIMNERTFERGQLDDPVELYQVNVFAAHALAVLAADRLGTRSIVNISSVNAISALIGARRPVYSSAKASLVHLSKMLAVKLAPQTRVNVVSPGRTRTDVWDGMDAEREAAIIGDSLLDRWVQPEEIADAVWFLHGNEACTGVDLPVDAGISLSAAVTGV